MKRAILVFVGFFFIWQSGFAQKQTISGLVTSKDDGLPIIGASIVEKGTTNGTVTNFDGIYKLSVSPGATLIFTYVGMAKQELKTTGESTLNVVLNSSSIAIEEVVVTAMGVRSEKEAEFCCSEFKFNRDYFGAISQLCK